MEGGIEGKREVEGGEGEREGEREGGGREKRIVSEYMYRKQ